MNPSCAGRRRQARPGTGSIKEEEQKAVTFQSIIPLIVAVVAAFWFVVAFVSRKTNSGTAKLALVGGVLAIVMVIDLVTVMALSLTITAAIAIPLFVAAIVEFGFIIALAARALGGRVSQRAFTAGMVAIVAAILIGVVLMFQQLTPVVFNLGFDIILIALLAFNIWSHITPRPQELK